MDAPIQPEKLSCPRCFSRLTILETHRGARIVFVAIPGFSVERTAKGLERLMDPGAGSEITCPACDSWIDPRELPEAVRSQVLESRVGRGA